MKTGIILLAAGSSKRLGQPKQLLDFKGETLIKRMVNIAINSDAEPVIVVLGAHNGQIEPEITDLPVSIIINNEWEKGLGSSVKKGLNHLNEQFPETETCILMVVDQPLVDSSYLNLLINEYNTHQEPIIASQYSDTIGVPVLYGKAYMNELKKLPDDKGAKELLLSHEQDVHKIPFPGGRMDIDTMEDYHKIMDILH